MVETEEDEDWFFAEHNFIVFLILLAELGLAPSLREKLRGPPEIEVSGFCWRQRKRMGRIKGVRLL
jgi:hypothetical protein